MASDKKKKTGAKPQTSLVEKIREKLLREEEAWAKRANEVIERAGKD